MITAQELVKKGVGSAQLPEKPKGRMHKQMDVTQVSSSAPMMAALAPGEKEVGTVQKV